MSDPTRFDLDDRQRAMLAEMGVRVWWPQRPADEQLQAQAQTPTQALAAAPDLALPASQPMALAPAAPPVTRPAAPAPKPAVAPMPVTEVRVGQPLAEGVDQMDWAALQTTVATCQACDLCANRQQAVFGVGDVQADWLVIGDPQVEAEGQHGEPFVGPAKRLLDNMLMAVGLSREAKGEGAVYVTSSLKCRLPGSRNPSPQELATCAPYLARQVALVQPKVIVVMGRFSIQAVLQSSEPLGKLRGQIHSYQGVPVVATYHPDSLLRNLPDKAKAWADLVLALKTVRGT
ncbi:uracil-DNA glycosylase [Limnohabitans sp. G3-2]|uniref:uracil-DNA glycosylase n=1 Tax=Limnohabitans sp. G3-2 TaxID=1100711 RepID=UPI000C1DD251|nr:uracil-DNA glycosylase [Limnohabitans sp. G3-2]PIT76896.1 uracil-DNA glycosylase [Limnohabitans sp. G3-2]